MAGMENVSAIGEFDSQDRLRAHVGGEYLPAVARGLHCYRLVHSFAMVRNEKSRHVACDVEEQIDPVVGFVGDQRIVTMAQEREGGGMAHARNKGRLAG